MIKGDNKMKRSNDMLPFSIILILTVFVTGVVLLANTSFESIHEYDVLGIGNLKKDNYTEITSENAIEKTQNQDIVIKGPEKQDNVKDSASTPKIDYSETVSEESESVEPTMPSSDFIDTANQFVTDKFENTTSLESSNVLIEKNENEEHSSEVQPNQTIETDTIDIAEPIFSEESLFEFNKEYSKNFNKDTQTETIEFYTTDEDCDYRLHIKTRVSETPFKGTIHITLFDERGIKLGETKYFQPYYSNGPYYRDEIMYDYALEKSKAYKIKLSTENSSGDYHVSVSKQRRDAGSSKENATSMLPENEITATINSTIDYWYVCDISESGNYEITLHNIDIGTSVELSAHYEDKTLFSINVYNENNETRNFNIDRPGKVYFQLDSDSEKSNGTYIMIVKKSDD